VVLDYGTGEESRGFVGSCRIAFPLVTSYVYVPGVVLNHEAVGFQLLIVDTLGTNDVIQLTQKRDLEIDFKREAQI
jgi:hypothetical protein